ncbi:Uncharacterised protein [Raoultella terrigena]|uniref:Uncharacterized protein n=1 Tax=Raoultella terrigena TaxID=577 RepID=A0A4U9DBA4_RAOTE|nr:Uncharacterised protein [Raoultella terrigena]
MMITLRKLPLAVAVAAALCLLRRWPSISTVMLVPALAGPAAAVNSSASRQPVLKVNTVLVRM